VDCGRVRLQLVCRAVRRWTNDASALLVSKIKAWTIRTAVAREIRTDKKNHLLKKKKKKKKKQLNKKKKEEK
jgi:ABC-type nickel/cobalt efflux system permease component RcnA